LAGDRPHAHHADGQHRRLADDPEEAKVLVTEAQRALAHDERADDAGVDRERAPETRGRPGRGLD
jgi:hypothetical protein